MGWRFVAKRDGKCGHCHQPYAAGEEIYAKTAGVYLGMTCGCGMLAENETPVAGPRETAVLNDLARLPGDAQQSMIAQNMLGMARQLDEGDVAPRDVPNYTKELRLNQMQLADMFPAIEDEDETETVRRKRERRAREGGGI